MATIKELKEKCKKLGLRGYTRLSKADLEKFLLKHSKSKSTQNLVKSKTKKPKTKLKLNKTQKEIAVFIFVTGKPLTFKDIEYSSDKTSQTVYKNLMGLLELGYVSRYLKGNTFMYELTDMGKNAYYIFIFNDKQLKTMDKKLRSALIKSFKELAKSSHEYSIALDFERHLKSPERFVAYRGGRTSTSKIGDFEIFGHTHPGEQYVRPSIADIKGLQQNVPEFIIAGSSGDIYIFTLTNKGKWNLWKRELNKRKIKQSHGCPIKGFLTDIKKNHPNFTYQQWYLIKEKGRKIFFEITGVKVIPYTKGMTIKMRDDPIKENKMLPKFSIEELAKYHKS